MKLLNRTTLIYVLLDIPIILLAMAVVFFLIQHYNLKYVEKNISEEHLRITEKTQFITEYDADTELSHDISVEPLAYDELVENEFSTVMIYDSIKDTYHPFRQLETMQKIAGKPYKITIRRSLVETSTLLFSIGISMTLMLMAISLTSILLNRIIFTRHIWTSFYSILDALKRFKAGEEYKPTVETDIDEFVELNTTVSEMTAKINKDFFVYKEFIDIVSHEYQTPLSVIGNNAELLLQNDKLSEEDVGSVTEIIEYIRKLNRLNKSLLLLSRIDNLQYVQLERVSVKKVVQDLLRKKRNQLEYKKIDLRMAFDGDVELEMDPALADVLFGNLIQNAVRHNYKSGGHIVIELRKGNFHIYNTGEVSKQHSNDEIFLKYYRESATKKSIGLGLSIVKSICQQYNFTVMYEFDVKTYEHHFVIRFGE